MQVSMTSKIHFDLTNYKAFLLGQSNSSTSKSGKTVLSSFSGRKNTTNIVHLQIFAVN